MSVTVTASRALALRIVRRLRELGHAAYFAGGCVRDALLRVEPKDYDVASNALPEQIEAAFSHTVAIGKQFGVIRVLDEQTPQIGVEVATFRADGPYLDGRRPTNVRFSGAEEDARRRDFTINGMFYDPLEDKVIDYVGGQDDLKARIVRAIGDARERFAEDKLRLLRAVRFTCRMNFSIDEATWAAVCEMAADIRDVSAERVREELHGMLLSPARGRACVMLLESGLLPHVLPEVASLVGVAGPHGDLFAQTVGVLDLLDPERTTPALAWAALLHAAGGKMSPVHGAGIAYNIMRRLKHPRDMWNRVSAIVEHQHTPDEAPAMRTADLKRFLRRCECADVLELNRLLHIVCGTQPDGFFFCRLKLEAYAPKAGLDPLRPATLLDGNDLRNMGIPPGPAYARLLRDLETEVLEERITTRAQAVAFIENAAKK